MSDMTILPVRDEGWTVDDLDLLPEDGLRYELVDGTLRVSPPPPTPHNLAATELAARLISVLDRSWRVAAPGSVRLDLHNRREPDVLVLRRGAAGLEHTPPQDVLLAVEVMSPSSVTDDRLVKPSQYAQAGIPHYWRIEPRVPVLVTFALDGDTYRETGRYDGPVVIDDPVRLRFRLADLLP
jgi:Uma2 family endonuclease